MQVAGVELEDLQWENIGSWPIILQRALILLVLLATIFLGYFFDLSDLYTHLTTITQERMNKQENYFTIHHQAINLEAYRQQVTEVKNTIEVLTQQLPKSNEEADLLEEISQQAASSGLQFRSIKPLPEESKGFYMEQPIQLFLEGTYNGFGEFVSNLSNLPRIVTLHDFTLKNLSPDTGKMDINIVAKTYWAVAKEKSS